MKSLSLTALVLAVSCLGSLSASAGPVPRLKNVLWIWTENTPYATLSTSKYLKGVWQNHPSVRLTKMLPVSKVTQANVLALISGSDQGVTDNELTRVMAPTIVDLLETRGLPWRVYAEDYPGSCYPGAGTGYYKRYRMPFISVAKVQSDRYLCSKIVSFRNFDEDLRTGQLPQLAVVIPNLKSSGAMSAWDADTGLYKILEPFLRSPELMESTTIVITTTNNADPKKPELYTLLVGRGIAAPAQTVNTPYNHYHLLRTLEEGLELGHLNQNDAKAEPMSGFWAQP